MSANRNKIVYEWTAEIVDEHGDIQDALFDDALSYLLPFLKGDEEIALVRSVYTHAFDELLDRQWAYITDGTLPECFEDSRIRVPQRFRAEARATWVMA